MLRRVLPYGLGIVTLCAALAPGADCFGQALSADARLALGEESPAVLAIMDENPQTADRLVPAIITMLNFDKPLLAQGYARRLVGLKLDENQLANLGEKLGSTPFTRIMTNEATKEIAVDFCKAVLAALARRKTNPARLDDLAKTATELTGFARSQAIFDLREAGPMSVEAVAKILADPAKADRYPPARDVLVQLGDQAVQPLLAVLTTEDENLKTEVLLTLSRFRTRETMYPMLASAIAVDASRERHEAARLAVKRLLGAVPSNDEATRMLYQGARNYLNGRIYIASDLEGIAEHWKWNDHDKKLVIERVPAETLSAVRAARIMEELLANAKVPQVESMQQLDPRQRAIMRMTLLAILQAHKMVVGLDAPLDPALKVAYVQSVRSQSALEFDLLEDVLEMAIDRDYIPAAIAAAELLGESAVAVGGNPYLLRRRNPQRSPVVRAASHTDRRLRFTATQAILKMQPDYPFAGSSVATQSLRYFANATGERRILIADPRASRGQLMVGLLSENGYVADRFYTGREAMLGGTKSPEYLAALIAFTIGKPDVAQLLQDFRSDPRTADVPVGLIVDPADRLEAERLAADDPLTTYFVIPRDATTMQIRIDQLTSLAGNYFVSPEVRRQQAGEAMKMLAALSEQPQSLFDLSGMETVIESALYLDELAPLAASALGNLASPAAQRALVDMASQPNLPLANRKAAAQAFAQALEKRGIGLTIPQIQRQADRYNQIYDSDPESEEVLWLILDAIQSRGRAQAQAQQN